MHCINSEVEIVDVDLDDAESKTAGILVAEASTVVVQGGHFFRKTTCLSNLWMAVYRYGGRGKVAWPLSLRRIQRDSERRALLGTPAGQR